MRNAGDRMPGGSPSRRQRAADTEPPPPGGGASLFTPAYRTSQPATESNRDGASGRSWSDSGQAAHAAGSGGPTGSGGPGGASGPSSPSGSVWPDDDLRSAYSWATDDE